MRRATYLLLWVVVFMLPFENMLFLAELPSITRLVGLTLLFVASLGLVEGMTLRLPTTSLVVMLAFFLWNVLSYAWSVDPPATVFYGTRLFNNLVLVWVIWEFCQTPRQFVGLMAAYVFGHSVPLAMSLSSRFQSDADRFSGGGHDLNYLAELMVIAIMISIYLATNTGGREGTGPSAKTLAPRTRRSWFYWCIVAVLLLATLRTGSRAGFVGLVIAAMWATIFLGAKRWGQWCVLILVVSASIAFLVPVLVPSSTLARMVDLQQYTGSNIENRLNIWTRGWESFVRRPVLGGGLGTFAVLFAETGRKSVAHNLILSIAVELGLVGLILYFSALLLLVRKLLGLPRRELLLWLGILFSWFIYSLTGGGLVGKLNWYIYGMALTGAAILSGAKYSRRLFYPSDTRAKPVIVRPYPRTE